MKNKSLLILLILILSLCSVVVFAAIPGSINELYNGSFDLGSKNLDGWIIYSPVSAGDQYLQSASLSSSWLTAVSQWVDESKNPLWLWNGVKKEISLDTKIKLDPGTGVKFVIEYWDNDNAQSPDDLFNIPRTGVLSGQTYYRFNENDNNYADWTSVTPFTDDLGDNAWIKDCQPRWLRFYIMFQQPSSNNYARVDDLNLTSKCAAVPEPSGLLAALTGVVGLVGFVTRKRKE